MRRPDSASDDVLAGVEDHEVAGAVGVLALAGAETHLPHGRRLLVAERPGQRHLAAEWPAGAGRAVEGRVGARADLRQHRAGDAEEPEQLLVPVQRPQVHEHGAARVGHVGDVHAAVGAAGEVPQQPGVDGAEREVAALRVGTGAVDVLEDPLHLARGEVRSRRYAGPLADHLAPAGLVEGSGDPVGAGVLPDDRVVDGPAGAAVPDDGGLALVGDAEGGQVAGLEVELREGRADHGLGALPDLQRVVLDPPRLRQDLLVLELVAADLGAVMVEHHEAGAGRPLVHRPDEIGHAPTLAGAWRGEGARQRSSRDAKAACGYPKGGFASRSDTDGAVRGRMGVGRGQGRWGPTGEGRGARARPRP